MGSKELTFLQTTIPRVKKKILPRRNIAKIIENTPLDEMVYLFAPYGYGKTMAVMSWLHDHKKETAWVSLKEGDMESPTRLWELLIIALLRYVGEQDKIDTIFQDACFSENPRGFLSETIIHVAALRDDRVLVIDDCRFIHDTGLLQDLKALIGNMLSCWRIILIGRGELPSTFNDFTLKKQLRLITVNELSFSMEEMSEYFFMDGYDVSIKDLNWIREETNGWPAALNAILTTPHNGIVRYSSSARSCVMGYFETEIWQSLDEKTKEFLMKTSILDKLTPSICHSITGIIETYPILNRLYINGFFMLKMEEFNSYYYHRVFKDFLLYKLYGSGIDVNTLYVTVGWWYYERNESISALLSFYKAKNISGINQAFKKVFPANIGMDKYVEVASCLTSLDLDDLKDYPEVAARIALLHFIMGDIEEMQRIYEVLRTWYNPGTLLISREEYIDFTWEMGWLRYVNPDDNILFDKDFEEWVNVKDYAPHLQESDRSRSLALRLPSAVRSVRDYSVNPAGAEEYYKDRIRIDNSSFIRDKADLFLTDLIIAEIAYEKEDYCKAERIVYNFMPEIEKEKLTDLYFMCTVLQVKILRAKNTPKEIDKLINLLGAMIENNKHHFLLPNFHAFELRNRLENGNTGMTEVFKNENEQYEDKSYYYLIYRHITFVRALLSEGKYIQANLVLGHLDLLCRQYKRNADLIEVNILRSVSEYGLENKPYAQNYLQIAIENGRKCGFIRIFADDAALIWPVLSLINKRDSDEYVEKIRASCKLMLERTGAIMPLNKIEYDPLTDRELEILKLLQTGMQYKEIAISVNVKHGTVKGHIHAIYSKLHVKNRMAAVAVAQRLKLL